MPNKTIIGCPYLGFVGDPTANFGEPSDAQQCYSPREPGAIPLHYQQDVCLTNGYCECKRFVQTDKTTALVLAGPAVRRAVTVVTPRTDSLAQRIALRYNSIEADTTKFAEIALWAVAVVLAFVALYFAQPLVTKWLEPLTVQRGSVAVAAPTSTPTIPPTATPTATYTATPAASLPAHPNSAPLILPTPPNGGIVLTLSPNQEFTGWYESSDAAPRWGDRALIAGWLQNKSYDSVLTFDAPNLAPGSEIVYAALELTGRDGSQLGNTGVWQLELMDGAQIKSWSDNSTDLIASTTPLAIVGNTLSAPDLAQGITNDFVLNPQDLPLIQSQLDSGHLTFRLRSPEATGDSLFVWESGASSNGLDVPTLYLIAIPKPLVVITNTPFPTNVFTAAAQALKATAQANKLGTPTPFPRGIATATAAPATIFVPPPPTPANAATRQAESNYATAVAITTGTYTPTPDNIVIAYPTATPVLISIDQVIPPATLTPASAINYFATPMPPALTGKILVQSNRLGTGYANQPLVMDETGKVVAILSTRGYYDAAAARESFAPDRKRRAIVAADVRGILQVWIYDLQSQTQTPVTNVSRGIAYDPVWSPDGTRIAYVSTETGITEIFVYDIETKTSRQLTHTEGPDFFNQRPSWSPDSQKLVFKSNRDDVTRFQIYLMKADGTDSRNISLNQYDETDPIWVKP